MPTKEPSQPETAEVLEAAKVVRASLAENIGNPQGICFMCKAPVERKEQIGRCVYMRPCGHSYQGRIKRR